MSEQIQVLLVDDHEMVRIGLKFFFVSQPDILIVGEAANGVDAKKLVEELHPDVVLMDIVMPDQDGIEVTRDIKKSFPTVNFLMVTSYLDESRIVDAIYAGASGYVMKDVSPITLAQAIRIVADGGMYISPQVSSYLSSRRDAGPGETKGSWEHLTEREQEVLTLVARGFTNHEISETLTISEKTVKVHVSNILKKMGFTNRTQAALFSAKHPMDEKNLTTHNTL